MKTAILLITLIFSCQLQAACKCQCDIKNLSLCASSYDLDNPCTSACPGQAGALSAPARTACPMIQVYNELKGTKVWYSTCNE